MVTINSQVKTTFTWNNQAKKKLASVDDEILYDIAKITLDLSYDKIPLATYKNSGRLRLSSVGYGVQKENTGYSIGSETSYAKYVYNMNDSTTHWSTQGTGSQWYKKTWQKQGKSITSQAIERNKLR